MTSTADTGAPGTLRWAVNQANAAGAGSHSILFSLPASSTIALASPLPTLNNATATITINGVGASGLSVSGVSPNQIFSVQNGPVTITNLTVAGTGGLSKVGTGTVTLSGANTYSGGTTVSAGILQGTTSSLQGNVTNNANATFNQATAGTYSGVMSGTGSLTKSGTGTVTLSGANTYSGGTTVSAGALHGDTTSVQGNVSNNANVTLNQATSGTYSGVMSGTGSLTKSGAGAVTLSGTNTYTGGTTVSAGVLQGTTTTVRGNITNNANVTYDQSTTGTYSGVMSGTGSLTKTGTGTAILSGANTYSGGTTVSAGVLQGTTTSVRGNITNNANVTLNQTTAGTYSGVMSGTGSLTKSGTGTVTLSGANTYSGGTTVSAGILQGTTASLQGNVANNANVTLSQTTAGTYSGVVSGTGSLTKSGSGAVTLSGTNTYTGGTTVSAGILQGTTTSVQGNIINNANVTLNQATAGTYSGVMSGTGSLTKSGTGTVTLSGANTYSGGTTVSAGALHGDTTTVRGNITNNANVTYIQTTTGTYSGVMSGTGSLTKTGAGTAVLSGANTYSGGTTVSDGVLQGTTTSVRGNITNNANVTYDQTTTGTYSGVMSGTGGLTKTGTGTAILSGANTYSGGTTVMAGTLQGTTTSLQGNVTNNANVTLSQTTAGTYSGVVGGTGSLTKSGTGTVTLSGANTYSGGTTVSAGSLQGTTTSVQGNIINNANVTLNQATAGTYSGVMSGTGSLTKSGAGTVTLSGANTYSGGTTVSAGALHGDTTTVRGNITNNANVTYNQVTTGSYSGVMSGTGSLTKNGTGTAILSGANTYTGGTTVSAGILQGTTTSVRGNITNNANVTYDQSIAGTYSGVMSGTGSLTKTGSGTAILSGANTYSGGTTVSDGVLQGNTTSVRGSITNNANVTFNQTSAGTYSGVNSGTGSLTKIGTSTLILSGANTYTGGTTVSAGILQGTTTSLQGNVTNNANVTMNQSTAGTYSGVMSGTGSLTKSGTGTVTLSGANTYSGGTTVSAGALHGDTTSVQGNIANSTNVTFNQSTTGTYSGVMSGTGSLTKNGTGTAILSGANTYTGGTTVSAGILQGTTTSVRGNITNNANITYDQSTTGSYSGVMSGTGSLTKTGTGTAILSGANTYSGGTTVSAGVLQGTTTSIRGNITNNANVTLNQTTAGTYSGVMSGTGSLTKSGIGTVTLSGANTYTGGTTVSAGILQGTTTNVQGNITNNANVTLNQATAGTYSGVMSGTGGLTKSGTGAVTLSGANAYTGGTTVSAGILQGTTSSVQGNVTNNANVTLNQATAGTYSGVMSGTGGLTKSGTGTAILSGANTYSGNTSIVEGLLAVDGSLTSNVTVSPNGVLGGNGTVSGNVVNQGAVAAGNSIGTLSMGGNYTQAAGSSMQVEVETGGATPGVNNDLVDVVGTATISGGTVEVSVASGGYDSGTRYTFLTASGGVNGVFAGIVDDSDFLQSELGYTADTVYFTLTFAQTDFAAIAQTPNEFAVADYLDDISTSASGDLQVVLVALSLASDDEARSALNQISGELYGTLGQIGVQNTTLALSQLSQRIRLGTLTDEGHAPNVAPVRAESATPYTLASYSQHPGRRPRSYFVEEQPKCEWKNWAFGFGLSGAADSDGNATGFSSGTGGMLIGTERRLFDNDRLGFFGGYLGTLVTTKNPDQSGSIHGGQFGSYTCHDDGRNYYTLIGGLQFNGYDTDRRLRFNGINREADGNFSGWQGFAYLERGVKFQSPRFMLQPYGALQYIYLRQNRFTESGADSLNLTVAGLDANSLRTQLGGRLQLNRWTHSNVRWHPEFRALWMHELLETSSVVNASFSPFEGGGFAVRGSDLGRDWALVGGGLRWEMPGSWSLYGNYDTQINARQVFHVGSTGAQLIW